MIRLQTTWLPRSLPMLFALVIFSSISLNLYSQIPVNIDPVSPVCENTVAFDLTADVAGGEWSGDGIIDSSLGTFSPANAGPGLHTITYTLADGISIDTYDIEVYELTPVTIEPVSPVCIVDGSFDLVVDVPGGSWWGPGITNSVSGTFDPATAGAGVHTIFYNIIDGNGCRSNVSIDITVSALPNPEIVDVDPVCINATPFMLESAEPGGTWSGDGISDGVNGIFDPAAAGEGMHEITYTITNAYSCMDSDVTTIEVYPVAQVIVQQEEAMCLDESNITLTANISGGLWSGEGIIDVDNGIFSPGMAGEGDHIISYEVTDANGCKNSDDIGIKVHDLPSLSITPIDPVCQNTPEFNLEASPSGGLWAGIGIVDSDNGTFDPETAGSGMRRAIYSYTDANGCSNLAIEDIEVLALPESSIEPLDPMCINDESIRLLSDYPDGHWSGPGIIDENTGDFDPSIAGAGLHSIIYEISDSNECYNQAEIEITVNGLPEVNMEPVDPVCENGVELNLAANHEGGLWEGTGVTDGGIGLFNPEVAGPGDHLISFSFTDENGCNNMDEKEITVKPVLAVSVQPLEDICLNASPFHLSADKSGGFWEGPGITDATSGLLDPDKAGAGDHQIIYNFENENGCISIHKEDIHILPAINNNIYLDESTLVAEATGVSFQWINCLDNSPIQNQTGSEYLVERSGSYAVEITQDGCTEISTCFDVTIVGIDDRENQLPVSVYPNPSVTGKMSLTLNKKHQEVQVAIRDARGNLISRKKYHSSQNIQLDLEGKSGIYFLDILVPDGQRTMLKVWKE